MFYELPEDHAERSTENCVNRDSSVNTSMPIMNQDDRLNLHVTLVVMLQ